MHFFGGSLDPIDELCLRHNGFRPVAFPTTRDCVTWHIAFRSVNLIQSVRRFDSAIDAVPRNFDLESTIRKLEWNAVPLPRTVSVVSVKFPNKALVGENLWVTAFVTLAAETP